MVCIPSLAKTASNMPVNLESRSRIKNFDLRNKVTEVHQQIACLLAKPVCGGMCDDAQDGYPAVGVLDDRKAVQARE
jgi:hypothetical protein